MGHRGFEQIRQLLLISFNSAADWSNLDFDWLINRSVRHGRIRGLHRVSRNQVTTHPASRLDLRIPAKDIKG